MNQVGVSIDFFGGSGIVPMQALLNQSSNNRARKTAFNNLFRLAKASGLIARNAIPCKVEIAVDKAGQMHLQFVYGFEKVKAVSAPESSLHSQPKPQTIQQLSLDAKAASAGKASASALVATDKGEGND